MAITATHDHIKQDLLLMYDTSHLNWRGTPPWNVTATVATEQQKSALMSQAVVQDVRGAVQASCTNRDYYNGNPEDWDWNKSNGSSVIGLLWAVGEDGIPQHVLVWQKRIHKLYKLEMRYMSSLALRTARYAFLGKGLEVYGDYAVCVADSPYESCAEADGYIAMALALGPERMSFAVQRPLGIAIMNADVRQALVAVARHLTGGDKERVDLLLNAEDGAILDVPAPNDDVREAHKRSVKEALDRMDSKARKKQAAHQFCGARESQSQKDAKKNSGYGGVDQTDAQDYGREITLRAHQGVNVLLEYVKSSGTRTYNKDGRNYRIHGRHPFIIADGARKKDGVYIGGNTQRNNDFHVNIECDGKITPIICYYVAEDLGLLKPTFKLKRRIREMTVGKLKNECKKLKLDTGGKKKDALRLLLFNGMRDPFSNSAPWNVRFDPPRRLKPRKKKLRSDAGAPRGGGGGGEYESSSDEWSSDAPSSDGSSDDDDESSSDESVEYDERKVARMNSRLKGVEFADDTGDMWKVLMVDFDAEHEDMVCFYYDVALGDDVTVEDCEYSGVDEVRKWISAHQKSHKRR